MRLAADDVKDSVAGFKGLLEFTHLFTHTPSRALAGEKSRDRFGLFDMTQDVSVTRTCSRDFPL